uniref:Uncharacterized protein n=1 Tax=Plectus sambesii TaxID=2011161 RepID=A0A914WX81_9BILA
MEATRVERLIKQLSTVRHPDAIVISIGGDDLHLADAIRSIIVGSPQPLLRSANATLDQVEHSLNELGAAIHDMRIDPRTIMLMEYYDVFRDEYGHVSAECTSAGLATSANFLAAEELIRRPFNKILAAAAVRNEWTYVDGIDEVFATHGLCSPSSMIVGFDESLNRQGNVLGAFYPNNKGHELVAQVLWQMYLRPYLQQVAGLP